MAYKPGQAILGSIPFPDGNIPKSKRPYLIVDIGKCLKKVYVVTISSLSGKAHKIAYPSNYLIENYKPPFRMASFAKLDSKQEVSMNFVLQKCTLLSDGRPLCHSELEPLLVALSRY